MLGTERIHALPMWIIRMMIEKKVPETIGRYQMLKNGDTVIVALSGGGDSMALFHFLCMRRADWNLSVRAAHVNHGIRGAEAEEDAQFVRRVCAEWNVELDEIRLSPPPGCVDEAWARTQRYTFLEKCAGQYGAKVATAHTRSDQAETVLLNLARGCVVKGAAGIPPVRGVFIRPFLEISHEDVLAYLKKYGLSYRTDSTNQDRRYTRNAIRLDVLPALERARPGASQALARFAAGMEELSAYLRQQATQLLQDAYIRPLEYDAMVFRQAPAVVCKSALAQLIEQHVKQEKTALTEQVYKILKEGGAVQLGRECVLRVSQDRLRVEPPFIPEKVWQIPFTEGVFNVAGGIELAITFLPVKNVLVFGKDEKKAFNFYADCDKILRTAQFRTRRPGDRFLPPWAEHSQALKKMYSQAKISPVMRSVLPVLAQESRVLWAANFGFAKGLEITADTKQAVQITWRQMEAQKDEG